MTDGLAPGRRRLVGRTFLALADRAFVLGGPKSPSGPTLRALGLRWTRSTAEAAGYAERVGREPRTRRSGTVRLARATLEIGATGVAARLLDALPSDDAGATELALRAEVDLQLGRYTAAAERAASAIALRPGDRTAQAVLARARAELTVLTPGWRPELPVVTHRPTPVPGRVLHLLTNSLPYREAGYTVRAQNVARCQIEAGLDPQMATRAGFPRNDGPPERPSDVGRRRRDLSPPRAGPRPGHRRSTSSSGPSRGRPGPRRRSSVRRSSTRRPTTSTPRSPWRSATDSGSRSSTRSAASSRRRGGRGSTRTSPTAIAIGRRARSRPPCMRDADAVVTLSETMRPTSSTGAGSTPDRVVVVPNGVDVERFVPGPRDAGAGRPARGRRRSGHRLHLELHRLRGDPLPHRGDRRAPPARSTGPLPARRGRRGAGRARGRRDRGRRRRRHGHLHRARPARRRPRLLPADRRLRRPAHERPGLPAGHAAQALRGDGDGARPGRERGRGPARDRRRRRDRSIVPTRRTRSTWPTSSSHSSTTRPSASAWAGPPGSG